MADRPGHLWALVQEWLDTFRYRPPSQRELAKKLEVSNSTLGDYKFARSMPPPVFVIRLAQEMQVPYEKVLDAVLQDRGYRGEGLVYFQAMVNAESGQPRREIERTEDRSDVG